MRILPVLVAIDYNLTLQQVCLKATLACIVAEKTLSVLDLVCVEMGEYVSLPASPEDPPNQSHASHEPCAY
jgi:hypothetical protein